MESSTLEPAWMCACGLTLAWTLSSQSLLPGFEPEAQNKGRFLYVCIYGQRTDTYTHANIFIYVYANIRSLAWVQTYIQKHIPFQSCTQSLRNNVHPTDTQTASLGPELRKLLQDLSSFCFRIITCMWRKVCTKQQWNILLSCFYNKDVTCTK